MKTPSPRPTKPDTLRFLRFPEIRARRSISSSTHYRHVDAGLMTPPVKLGPNTAAWPEHEIDAIDRARLAGADDDAIRTLVRELIEARTQQAAA
jgi:prophage regulatory protein